MDSNALAKLIREANEKYHNTGQPIMSDAEYDALVAKLEEIDPNHPVLAEVGAPVPAKQEQETAKLPYAMPSLKKLKTDKELKAWSNSGNYVISDKLDGVSALVYMHGPTTLRLYTRGDGLVGRDITHVWKSLKNTKDIRVTSYPIAVRGEILVSKRDFESVKDKYSNPRNMVSGLVNAKKPDLPSLKKLVFVAYAVYHTTPSTPEQDFEVLRSSKFALPHVRILERLDESELTKILQERLANSDFELDGLVISKNIATAAPKTNEAPKESMAFKTFHTHKMVEAKVLRVEWNLTKDNILFPRVHIEPTQLDGTLISYATGVSAKEVQRLELGPDAIVTLVRSGGVIPRILATVKPAQAGPQFPTQPYEWDETNTHIRSVGEDGLAHKQILYFFDVINPKFVSTKTVEKIIDAGYDSIAKILEAGADDLARIDGFQAKSATRTVESIRAAVEHASCIDLMVASNLFGRGIGEKKLKSIIATLDLAMLLSIPNPTMPEIRDLVKIPGVQTKTAEAFLSGLGPALSFIREHGWTSKCKIPTATPAPNANVKSWVVNIVFSGFRDAKLQERVEALGGRVQSKVAQTTNFVVVKTLDSESSKVADARAKNIPILVISEFEARLRAQE